MAGLDPSIAVAANAVLQSQVQALDLGVELEILQAQLTIGDILTATVLPPQSGSDRLALLGLTVPAQLPPGIAPGEELALVVTGFAGNAILVQNLGPVDPAQPPSVSVTSLLPAAPRAVAPPPPSAPAAPAASTPPAVPAPIAPPRAVFVAASVQPAAAPPAHALPGAQPAAPTAPPGAPSAASPAPSAAPLAAGAQPAPVGASPAPPAAPLAAGAQSAQVAASPAPPATPVAPAAQAVASPATPSGASAAHAALPLAGEAGATLGIEARIAAARAAAFDALEAIGASPLPAAAAPKPAPGSAAPAAARSGAPAPPPPTVTARGQTAPAELPLDLRDAAPALAPETALLAQLRVPLMPLTLRAAHLIASAPSALPRVLARLDAALASVAERNPAAASLRTTLAFLAQLDPGNARALPEQLAAYVSELLGGPEAKLAAAVRSALALEAPPAAAPAAAARAAAPNAPPPNAPPPAGVANAAPPAPAAAPNANLVARVIERTVALAFDAKAAIASLIAAPPRGAAPELAPALNDALATITALQLNALQAQNADPLTFTIPLPVFYREGGAPTQLRVRRDAPHGGALDPDNFSIAFVLDTASLGIVAVDVQTSGRTVNLNVKTEAATAAARFRATLGDLRGRLEALRYRVAGISAAVAPHRAVAAAEPAPERDAPRSPSSVDLRA